MQSCSSDKADAETEAGARSSQKKAALTLLKNEMTKAGVLVKSIALKPSVTAKRLAFKNNAMHVTDGPFAESKELIGGFAILDLSSNEKRSSSARKYAEILGGTLGNRTYGSSTRPTTQPERGRVRLT